MSRAMKDSGVAWIGEIPEGWRLLRIKHLANDEIDSFQDGDWIESPYITDSGIRYLTTGNVGDGVFKRQGNGYITEETFASLNCKYAYPNDLIISRLNAPYGRACILPDDEDKYVLAVDIVILRTNHNKQYLCYLMQCTGYQWIVQDGAKGTTMKRISRTNLGNVVLPIAPLPEQSRIAAFLDRRCAEIDRVIAATQRTIEEYKKLKQSVITEAVTRGVHGERKMKASGVEWIGEIPEEWAVIRVKNLLVPGKDGIKVGPFGSTLTDVVSDEGTIRVYGQWNITAGSVNAGKNYISSDAYEELETYHIVPGDILISMMGTVGKCWAIPQEAPIGVMDSHVIKARLNSLIVNSRFFIYQYDRDNCDMVFRQIQVKKKGSIMDGLNSSIVKNFYMVLPPLSEQFRIVAFLDHRCVEIDRLIEAKQQLLTQLEAYKKSVIYEYVTGKREVPV